MESEVDLQVLERLRVLGGDELISKMIALFIPYAEAAIRDAAGGFAARNLDLVRRAAHSLKSSAGNVGALKIQALADQIEQSDELPTDQIERLLAQLKDAYFRAKVQLTEIGGNALIEDPDR